MGANDEAPQAPRGWGVERGVHIYVPGSHRIAKLTYAWWVFASDSDRSRLEAALAAPTGQTEWLVFWRVRPP